MDKERKAYEDFLNHWQGMTGPGGYETFRGGYYSRSKEIDILKADLMDTRVLANSFRSVGYKLRAENKQMSEEIKRLKKNKGL